MTDDILSKITKLVAEAEARKEKHIVLHEVLTIEVQDKLKGEGFGVYEFGKAWVISWNMPTGKTSGKIKIETILHFISQITGSSRNILCFTLTL